LIKISSKIVKILDTLTRIMCIKAFENHSLLPYLLSDPYEVRVYFRLQIIGRNIFEMLETRITAFFHYMNTKITEYVVFIVYHHKVIGAVIVARTSLS